jgi:hypothetical protein
MASQIINRPVETHAEKNTETERDDDKSPGAHTTSPWKDSHSL